METKKRCHVLNFLEGDLTLSEFLEACNESASDVYFGPDNQNNWMPSNKTKAIGKKNEIWILSLDSDCRQFSFFLPILCLTQLGCQVREVKMDPDNLETFGKLMEAGCENIFAIILNPFFRADVSILGKVQTICSILNMVPSLIIGGPSIRTCDVEKHFSNYNGTIYFCSQSLKAVKMIDDKFEGHNPMVFGPNSLNVEGQSEIGQPIKTIEPNFKGIKPEKYKIEVKTCWPLINDKSLYQMHLKYRGNFLNDLKNNVEKAVDLTEKVGKVKQLIESKKLISVEGYSLILDVTSKKNSIFLKDGKDPFLTFPRQQNTPNKCLSDYIDNDHSKMGIFVVSSGKTWIEAARQFLIEKKYTEFMILQALVMQTAEAGAEFIHDELNRRQERPSESDSASKKATKKERTLLDEAYVSSVQGKRYSPGYSACPDLQLQVPLFSLFKGVTTITLTESLMMNPINSVSGFVFFKPGCDYFSI
ncbi:hypothetical protein HOH45_02820 [bacterium]|nr:hypothetical protein [bacterium]